jgi:hypothetical protein
VSDTDIDRQVAEALDDAILVMDMREDTEPFDSCSAILAAYHKQRGG